MAKKDTYYKMGPWSEKFFSWFFNAVFSVFYDAKAYGRDNVPKTGAYILAPNHCSNFDPPLIAMSLNRPAYFMAKAELFKIPVLNWIIRWLGSFPVRRGAVDTVAIRQATAILERGDVLGMFPQGNRQKEGSFDKLRSGTASLAIRMGVPIIPVAIIGSSKMKRGHVAVNIGKPFAVEKGEPTPEAIKAVNDKLQAEIERLYREKEDILQ